MIMEDTMQETLAVIKTLLVEVFNDVLTIEEKALKEGHFNDVSVTEVHTIEAIGMYKSKSMGEVAKSLDITVGTLTVAINNLVKKGYVVRYRCENDRRVVNIGLTKKGRVLYRVHQKFHMDMVKASIEGLSKEEEIVLSKSLSKLNSFLNEKYFLSKGDK